MRLRPAMIQSPSVATAGTPSKREHGQRRAFNFGVNLRNPDTGQFSGAAVIPSPKAMQDAYPSAKGAATAAGASLPNELHPREVARAMGTDAVRSHPLGAATRAETENIGRTVAQFLRGKAKL